MRILVAEYATALNLKYFLAQGRAMLQALVWNFEQLGHQVIQPTPGISCLESWIESNAPECDAGLIIAPDQELSRLVEILEKHTLNLGPSPKLIRICADKLWSSKLLQAHGITVPQIFNRDPGLDQYLLKPRYGSGSEGIWISRSFLTKPGYLCCEYIPGQHLSLSLISSKSSRILLSINKQILDSNFKYIGGIVPYQLDPELESQLRELGLRILAALGNYSGYLGVVLVLHQHRAYVVDLNPRMTCSGIGLCKLLIPSLAQLILDASQADLPDRVELVGRTWIRFS